MKFLPSPHDIGCAFPDPTIAHLCYSINLQSALQRGVVKSLKKDT